MVIDLNAIREKASVAIGKIKPMQFSEKLDEDFLLKVRPSNISKYLPPHYLIYFLLVDLLKFKDVGKSEKIVWSIPIDFNSEVFFIEYRKSGCDIFTTNVINQVSKARDIADLIQKGIKKAEPFFYRLAEEKFKESEVNVVNRSNLLFERYKFFLTEYWNIEQDLKDREKEYYLSQDGIVIAYNASIKRTIGAVKWLALATIDAFFSWSEHVFIHLAILNQVITTAEEVNQLAGDNWGSKYKKAISLDNCKEAKKYYNELTKIRRQLRNFMTHGAFGKNQEAFYFHTRIGAVPMTLKNKTNKYHCSISSNELIFEHSRAIECIDKFISYLWDNNRMPAKLYIQDSGLPAIFTMAKDDTYKKAMSSIKEMECLIDRLSWEFNNAANMDW